MLNKTNFFVSLLVVLLVFPLSGSDIAGSIKLDAEGVVNKVCEKINLYYPFQDVASKVIQGLQSNLSNGKYAEINSPAVFASVVTGDMENLSHDKHLDLLFDPSMVSGMRAQKEKGIDNTYTASQVENYRLNNYGFTTLKIMEGNVGYLEMDVFFDAGYAGDTAVAVMAFFANCDALIIDLKNNGGGWGSMVSLLLSYFIDSEGELVMKITRSTVDNSYYAAVTLPYVPGKKLCSIPVYILISGSTASAAEAFALRMRQHNQRVCLVGEITAGAENPVDHQILDSNFILQIPSEQVIYQEKNGGWERIGIEPDIRANPRNALQTAYLDALKKLKSSTTSQLRLGRLEWALEGMEARQKPMKLPKSVLKTYTGTYDNSSVFLKGADIFYQYKKRSGRRMIPITAEYFLVEGVDHYRIRFSKDGRRGMVLKIIFNDGYSVTKTKSR